MNYEEINYIKIRKCLYKQNEDGDFIIVETTKDNEKVYNLTEKLNEFLEIEGVTLQMGKVEDFPSEE